MGPEKYPFYIHKGLLCQHSEYFQATFNGSFEEATTGTVHLDEDDVDVITLFEEWLYRGSISDLKDHKEPSSLLVQLFCFANRVGIDQLQNDVLDAIRDVAIVRQIPPQYDIPDGALIPEDSFKYLPPASSAVIDFAYEHTMDDSPLRRLLSEIFAYNVKPEVLQEKLMAFPKEFMADVMMINMKRFPLRLHDEQADFDNDASGYHIISSPASKTRRGRVRFESKEGKGKEVGEQGSDTSSRLVSPARSLSSNEVAALPVVEVISENEEYRGPSKSKTLTKKGKKKGARNPVFRDMPGFE